MPDFFVNRAGRPRSFWRLLAFVAVFFFVSTAAVLVLRLGVVATAGADAYNHVFGQSLWGWAAQSVMIFGVAALVGWGCGLVMEDLPWRSLGWAAHRGWGRDLLLGLLLGAAGIGVAFVLGRLFGGYRVTLAGTAPWAAVLQTLALSGLVFLLGAAAEEMLFRGYAFQTLLRSWPLWAAMLPTSVFFGLTHLSNPNVAPGFTMANTVLAGVWLAVAYWRTRSLWLAFGLHWGWNWAQGAVLGSPVSGITELTPDPLLRFTDEGPAWLGGGAYGIEGGAACTVALVLSTLFVWRTGLFGATPELREYTDGENPNPDAQGPPSVVPAPARLHLVYLRPEGMLLTKKHYADWREIQDEHADYMTSLGPFDEDGLVDHLTNQYGPDEARWGFTREQIRRFVESEEVIVKAT